MIFFIKASDVSRVAEDKSTAIMSLMKSKLSSADTYLVWVNISFFFAYIDTDD